MEKKEKIGDDFLDERFLEIILRNIGLLSVKDTINQFCKKEDREKFFIFVLQKLLERVDLNLDKEKYFNSNISLPEILSLLGEINDEKKRFFFFKQALWWSRLLTIGEIMQIASIMTAYEIKAMIIEFESNRKITEALLKQLLWAKS